MQPPDSFIPFAKLGPLLILVGPHSSALLRRASRSSTETRLHSTVSRTQLSPPPSDPSPVASRCRSYSGVSSAFRSVRSTVPRWSHGVDWKSPATLTSQIRTAASPLLDRFHRTLATMGLNRIFSKEALPVVYNQSGKCYG
ncbi:hypothetical protein L1987_19759 [Smallanthus sonchifolius]|uniref:Uncharacterized protein n=1 Tax=Smallanthus sonchifolius TaxID=185202 RepID=A0ACB9IQ58_9ASTR|nr:hypothetical protein L1987_19759 [Smallanthus sonchifolius]